MRNILTLEEYIDEYMTDILEEGGAYGHLTHPYEDKSLTFGDIKELIKLTVKGMFTKDNFVAEKTDGQNLLFTWKEGHLVAARSKAHLKNRGAEAIKVKDILERWADLPNVRDAFKDAFEDMEHALSFVDEKSLQDMFHEGERFMSIEVITPETENTIPYGLEMLVFHGWKSYDEDGNEQEEDKQSAFDIERLIKNVNQQQQKRFYIRGPQEIEIKPFLHADEKYKEYMDNLLEIQSISTDINDETTIGDYIRIRGKVLLFEKFPDIRNIDGINIDGIVNRITKENNEYKKTEIKKLFNEENKDLFVKYFEFENECTKSEKFKKEVLKPIMDLFMNLGQDMMRNMTKFLSANPTEASEKMKNNIRLSIKNIEENGDENDIEAMQAQMARISDPKAFEDIIPTEGITFLYKGKLYKYTGMFAVLNRINGILRYKRQPKSE